MPSALSRWLLGVAVMLLPSALLTEGIVHGVMVNRKNGVPVAAALLETVALETQTTSDLDGLFHLPPSTGGTGPRLRLRSQLTAQLENVIGDLPQLLVGQLVVSGVQEDQPAA